MRVTDFPAELLREIVRLSLDVPNSTRKGALGPHAGRSDSSVDPEGEAEDAGLPSPSPASSIAHTGPPLLSFDSRTSRSTANNATSGSSADKLKLALVCRTFWTVASEFLYASVSLSSASQAINLASGLFGRERERDARNENRSQCQSYKFETDVDHGNGIATQDWEIGAVPGYWVRELEIRSYFELDDRTAEALRCILARCTRLSALRISFSFLEVGRDGLGNSSSLGFGGQGYGYGFGHSYCYGQFERTHRDSEVAHILSAVPRGLVHFEFDATSVFSRRDREHALDIEADSDSESDADLDMVPSNGNGGRGLYGLYGALERISPTLKVLKLPASRYLHLFNRAHGRGRRVSTRTGRGACVLRGLTHLELCFSSPDMQILTHASHSYEDASSALASLAASPTSFCRWGSLLSLEHLTLSYAPPNKDADSTPVKFLLCMPPPSSMLFPISRRLPFPLPSLLLSAPRLLTLTYRPFSFTLLPTLWSGCASPSLKHLVLHAIGIRYSELHRNGSFDALREQLAPFLDVEAWPNLESVTVVTEHPCLSLEIVARSLKTLKEDRPGVQMKKVVLPSEHPIDWYDLAVM